MRNVTMVVPVLMTSCQVSEYRKIGPVTAHKTMINPAAAKAHFDPNHPDAEAANLPNQSLVILDFVSTGTSFIEHLSNADQTNSP
jgi:hypothetical protein